VGVVSAIYEWISFVLFWGQAVLWIWAVGDCSIRKAAAFPAVNKLSKGAWLAITVIAAVLGLLVGRPWSTIPDPVSLFALIPTIATLIYLADVRPAVREVSGGNRW
jgi:cytosine/uracil/thiamine/allantoin permease